MIQIATDRLLMENLFYDCKMYSILRSDRIKKAD